MDTLFFRFRYFLQTVATVYTVCQIKTPLKVIYQ